MNDFNPLIVDILLFNYLCDLIYFQNCDPYYAMAQKQKNFLLEMLNKWVPQYQQDYSSTALPNIKKERV